MGFIYKIENKTNGKVYIGKTNRTIEKRWKEHCNTCKRDASKNRPIYRAFNKYGIDNFSVEELYENKNDKVLCKKEIYYIKKYNSYGHNGYNATRGGDGNSYLKYTDKEIINKYKKFLSINDTAKYFKCNRCTVRRILKTNNIEAKSSSYVINEKISISVNMYDLKENYIKTFSSISKASIFIKDVTKCKSHLYGIQGKIKKSL